MCIFPLQGDKLKNSIVEKQVRSKGVRYFTVRGGLQTALTNIASNCAATALGITLGFDVSAQCLAHWIVSPHTGGGWQTAMRNYVTLSTGMVPVVSE